MPGILGHLCLHLSPAAPALLSLKTFVSIDSSTISMENEGKGLLRVTDLTGAKRIFACSVVTTPAGACVCFTLPGVCRAALGGQSRGSNFVPHFVF